jgi:hypothetical protein
VNDTNSRKCGKIKKKFPGDYTNLMNYLHELRKNSAFIRVTCLPPGRLTF